MKSLLLNFALIFCFILYAAEISPKERMLRATGGFVIKPGTQKGEVSYVNCQDAANVEWIKDNISYISDITKFKVALYDGKFDINNPDLKGNITIFIIDNANFPMLLCAPEVPWAAVNIAKLKSEKAVFFAARLKKELSRAFAMIAGASNSRFHGTLLMPVAKVEDLDHHVDQRLPADVIAGFASFSKEYGLIGELKTTYLNACKEGWAAQPTNEYQKAIWDRVHEIPSEPITIKPESHPAK